MTAAIIITLCILLLFAYSFDLTSAVTKIPSVILLLLLGWVVKQITILFGIDVPNLETILPVLATIGLVLIVLEGSLELELNKSKVKLIAKSFVGALLPILILSFSLAFLFQYLNGINLKTNLINAIPLGIISSAIAIPSVRNLSAENRDFVTYESSLSDIIGVILFNFFALNTVLNEGSYIEFCLNILIILIISIIATFGLALLLSKIEHHIKFVPIILIVILLYEVLKVYHLPALVFILLFGLAIGNLDELKHKKWIQIFKPEELDKEVHKFKEITVEGAFLIRSLFFILFGFLLETSEIFNPKTFMWSVGIVLAILVVRALQLKLSGLPLIPLLFVAPRGLITILLFLSIIPEQRIELVNDSLIIQVIVLSALFMMFGLMINKKEDELEEEEQMDNEEVSPLAGDD